MKLLYSLLFSIIILIFPQPIFAQENWVINEFSADITIQQDGVVKVVEKIEVDFSSVEKHGIYRDIPVIYSGDNESKIYTEIDVVNVQQDQNSAEYKLIRDDSNYLRIRIGDADRVISGKHTYVLTYFAKGVLASYDTHDELYWNTTGNYWEVPIQKAVAEVRIPEDGITDVVCFSGFLGERDACKLSKTSRTSHFESISPLAPGEGLTIVVGYTKGMMPILQIERPKTFGEKLLEPESVLLFLFAFLSGIVGVVLIWWRNGRDFAWNKKQLFDPDAKSYVRPMGTYEPIIVEYEPPEKLRPAEIGVLMDERADTLDITATIIDLATRGYLIITEVPKKWLFGTVDYDLSTTSKSHDGLISYEKELLSHLFKNRKNVKVSNLKTTFYEELQKVKEKLYEESMAKNLFAANPETTRGKYLAGGIAIIIFSAILLISGISNEIAFITSLGAGFLISGMFLAVASQGMPRRSAHGRELYRRSRGYKMFLDRAEKYRQPFFENKNLFNEVLPYAIVFGIAEKFAHAMQEMGVKVQNPSWYHSNTAFNPVLFSSNVHAFSSSMSSAIASAPKSSGFASGGGGGSSGGGFGGGGGGSW